MQRTKSFSFKFALPLALLTPILVWANPAHEQLMAKDYVERRAYLTHVLQVSGEACDLATRAKHTLKDENGAAYWAVECRDGNSYLIRIDNDSEGSTRIVNCALMAQLGIECFK